jgi:hypothetical protein
MPLPSRKRHTKTPSNLPKDFLKTVADLFGEQFKGKLKGSSFLVYGDLHGDEVVLCISLTHPKTLRAASMHISSDLPKDVGEKPEKVTEQLKGMVDVAASWFSQCLEGGEGLESVLAEMAELDPGWQEFDWEGSTLFVKINKDNYALEKAATDFLKKSGFREEDEDLDEELRELLGEDDDEDGSRGPLQ